MTKEIGRVNIPPSEIAKLRALGQDIERAARARANVRPSYEGHMKAEIAAGQKPEELKPVELMRCGHEVAKREAKCSGGNVYVQFTCKRGCRTVWTLVGEEPCAVSLHGMSYESGCRMTDAGTRGEDVSNMDCRGECCGCPHNYRKEMGGF